MIDRRGISPRPSETDRPRHASRPRPEHLDPSLAHEIDQIRPGAHLATTLKGVLILPRPGQLHP
jgi:hypothetical protein